MNGAPLPADELAAFRAAYRPEPGAADACPGDERLAALVAAEPMGEERARLADHVVACERCGATYRLLAELAAAVPPIPVRRRSAGGLRALAAAALVATLAGLGVWQLDRARQDTGEARRGAGTTMVMPADGATLTAPPDSLRWPPIIGATGYRLRLYDATAELLWESERVTETALELPPSAPRLTPEAGYFWVVAVEGPIAISRLGPFWFHLHAS